ncbi:hypothetical protein [Pseudorhodobacter aquimaris]|uniref:hypothetical protein n=1 Tax=Pseudorhodobacter aquimaris TaxID=687412 RepID=UPI001E524B76|nr:hypothetical protein [Pseudorhodobacter aquimaris]
MTDPDQTSPASLRVTIQDLRSARYCLAGVRPWFQRHGFDWQEFLDHGIASERLHSTGDALIEPVIQEAKTRIAAGLVSGRPEAQGGRK